MPPADLVGVTPPDLGTLLLHSLRYSMGRRSTAPSTTADLIRRHWPDIEKSAQQFLRRDLEEAFDRAEHMKDLQYLGDPCDVQTWADLRSWIRRQA